MFTCVHSIQVATTGQWLPYQRGHEAAEHGAEEPLAGALVEELGEAGGVEEEEGQAPDGVGRHHPVQGPHQHSARLTSLTCNACNLVRN